MKKALISTLLAIAAAAVLAPAAQARPPHKVCHWDAHHHHRSCHWVH